jgi:hypothetical protein
MNKVQKVKHSCLFVRHGGLWESGAYLHSFLTSASDTREWSASRAGRCTLGEISHGTHCTRGWVDLDIGLDSLEEKTPAPATIVQSRAIAQAVSRPLLTAMGRVQSQASPHEICGQGGTGTGLSPSTLVFSCHHHTTNVPYSYVHLVQTLSGYQFTASFINTL